MVGELEVHPCALSEYFQLGNPPAGQWYQVDFSIVTSSGTYSGAGSPYTLASSGPNHLTVQARIYPVEAGDCFEDTLVCNLVGRLVITAGTHTGSIPPVPGDTTVVSATSTTAGGLRLAATWCQPPFSSMPNAHVDVAG